MGYVPGKGLGKMSTGITEPVEESLHKGRRGLGFDLDGLEKEDVKWELEEVHVLIVVTTVHVLCDMNPILHCFIWCNQSVVTVHVHVALLRQFIAIAGFALFSHNFHL